MKFQLHLKLIALNMGLALLIPGVALAGFDEGFAAYKNKDYATALQEFKSLASQGDADAQFLLGMMYDNGQGVPQDYKESVKWYRLAAKQGDSAAQFDLGTMYDSGQGVPKDYKEAAKWYRLAAVQGHASAQYDLGMMYENGRGVVSSRVVAYALYNLSATIESSEKNKATNSRETLSELMSPKEINAAQDLTREMSKPGNILKALDKYLKYLPLSKR